MLKETERLEIVLSVFVLGKYSCQIARIHIYKSILSLEFTCECLISPFDYQRFKVASELALAKGLNLMWD